MPVFKQLLNNLDKLDRNEALEQLHSYYSLAKTSKERIKILEILNEFGDHTHYSEIESYFVSDEDPEVKIEAAKLLAFNYSDKKAIQPMIWVLNNESKMEVKLTAIRLLTAYISKKNFYNDIVFAINNQLLSEDKYMIIEAAESISIIGDSHFESNLIKSLDHKDKLVRGKIIQALGDIESTKSIPFILRNLSLSSLDLWNHAFVALQALTTAETLEKLLLKGIERLDTCGSLRREEIIDLTRGFVKALGELRSIDSIPTLLKLLAKNDYLLRREIISALNLIDFSWKDKFKQVINKYRIDLNQY